MAENAVVGALRVVIGADTAKFEEGMKRAKGQVDSFAGSITKIAAGIGLERAIEASVRAVVKSLTEGFDRIDKLGKAAQKVGLPVEEFTALKLSADLADVSMESLSTGLGKLSKNMVDTARGTGEAKKTFDALGISVTNADGTMKSASQVMTEIAGKFENTADGATKVAHAIALFGRGGKDLIPLLNEGAASLEEMTKVAHNMGLVIDKDTSAAVQKFNDDLKILKLAQEGVTNLVIAALIPALVRLSGQWVEQAKTGDLVRSTADGIVRAFKELVVVIYQVAAADQILTEAFKLFQDVMTLQSQDEGESFRKIGFVLGQMSEAMRAAREEATKLFTTITVNAKPTQELSAGTSKLTDTINDFILRTRVLRGDFAQLAPGFAEMAVKLKLTDDTAKGLSTTVAGLTKQQKALQEAMAGFAAQQLIQQALPPWQQFEQQMRVIDSLHQQGKLNAEQRALVEKKAAESTGQAWNIAGAEIAGNLAAGLQAFASQNKTLAAAAKAAAIAQAVFNTYTAATKALATYPPPLSYIAAGAAVVAGLGYVAKIKSQEAFAGGGSFRVGGGLTGVDSEMINFAATPGEIVDVRRPGQERGGGGGVQTIELRAPRAGDFFSENIRELVDSINRAAPDGYIIRMPAT